MTGKLANDARQPFSPAATNEILSDTAVTKDPADWEPVPVLSIGIPVYNELPTIGRILIEVARRCPKFPSRS